MNTYFKIGRKFKVFKNNQLGEKEEIMDPVIIEYVTREGLVEVEIKNGKVQKIVNTQTKEILERDVYNEEEYKSPKMLH
ncbi:hypothetical protein [Methanobacterium petrolearium]|uniref:hypothetical protein n=1 Tax=Methanobacterium petrolearium TaxID=710190 RepID=UPI001AEA0058|nr:hypothetical protein [Methanobacterium petrolearium]MBP1947013.1 hypothetical protein [Methanobacterium petrolearium]BDZ71441.1 hypothetical protein GCM10025861_19580 [Methanobacterium petrolearium]